MPYVNGIKRFGQIKRKYLLLQICGQLDLKLHKTYIDEHFYNPTELSLKSKEKMN